MRNLTLCFIHGFKSTDGAFYDFPVDLQKRVLESNSNLNVTIAIYPTYETKGDLPQSVIGFQKWLREQVADDENEARQEQRRIGSSPGVILVAHSMGGLVAADAFLSIVDNRANPEVSEEGPVEPKILGILAFDTPFCGLSRSMFAYGAFAQYQTVSSAYSLATSLSALALPGTANATAKQTSVSQSTDDKPAWKLWQMVAMRTGAAGAIGAAGAAAYMNREQIGKGLSYMNKESIQKGLSSMNMENVKQALSMVTRDNIEQGLSYMSRENIGNGFAWLTSHLRFVSHLMKGDELRHRIERLNSMKGVGFANLYTSLGENAFWGGGYFVAERTFCAIPEKTAKSNKHFIREVNPKAKDEVDAHVHMFEPNRNLGYEEMLSHAKGLVLNWADTYSGNVVDEYTMCKANVTSKAKDLPDGEGTFTKYTYSEASGFKEINDKSSENDHNTRWLNGISVPRYIELKKYIPLGFGVRNTETRSGGNSVALRYTKYYYDETGKVHEDGVDEDEAGEASERASLSSEYRDAVPEQTEAAQMELETDDDVVQIDTEHIPGVTEDLGFEENGNSGVRSTPDSVDATTNEHTPAADASSPGAGGHAETKNPAKGTESEKQGLPVEETYESFPSVETPCYETFAPLQSDSVISKKKGTTAANPHSDDSVIRRDYAPMDAKARLEQTLKLEPDEGPKTTQTAKLQNGRKSEMMNGSSNVHLNAQKPEANRRRSDLWNRWRCLSSQQQVQTVAAGQSNDISSPGIEVVKEKSQEASTSSWQWQPWRWRWRSNSSMTRASS